MSKSTQPAAWPNHGIQVVKASTPKAQLFRPCVYLLESNRQLLDYIRRSLSEQFDLKCFGSGESFLSALRMTKKVDVIVFAWETAELSLSTLHAARKMHPGVPLMLLCCSAEMGDYKIIASLGTASVVLKPFTAEDLHGEILEHLHPGVRDLDPKESVLDSSHSFVRASKSMHEVERQAALVAKSDIPVLILGESGTGKEILAIFVHKSSLRRDRIFMKINCAAMPAELLESELFGYEQGAFTGASRTKPGKFETCNGGTIFLDEIGEMPATLQAKLLQVLQDGTFSRLGSRSTMRTDVRVISATNIAMKQCIINGTFREDLYYRLNGLSIKLPPLRERLDEIPMMVRHFMQKGAERFNLEPLPITLALQTAMLQYHWPGNLRELENLVNRLLVLRDEQVVLVELQGAASAPAPLSRQAFSSGDSMRSVSATDEPNLDTIVRVLEENLWNRRAAADALKMSYKALLYKIKQHNLTRRSA